MERATDRLTVPLGSRNEQVQSWYEACQKPNLRHRARRDAVVYGRFCKSGRSGVMVCG